MFHGFNGEFRRKPTINVGGASKKESRTELFQRAQEERVKREVCWLYGIIYVRTRLISIYLSGIAFEEEKCTSTSKCD